MQPQDLRKYNGVIVGAFEALESVAGCSRCAYCAGIAQRALNNAVVEGAHSTISDRDRVEGILDIIREIGTDGLARELKWEFGTYLTQKHVDAAIIRRRRVERGD